MVRSSWSVSHKNILRLSWRQTLNGKISLFYLFLKMYLYFDIFNSFYSSLFGDRKKKELMESLYQRNETQFSVSLCALWAAKLLGERIILSFVTPHCCFYRHLHNGKNNKEPNNLFLPLCSVWLELHRISAWLGLFPHVPSKHRPSTVLLL